ncbi:hypothetical protein [Actinospica robiniae]|uniref:hypothetical protein n=1 Tax=Actinospica robiniae TaxID=304901 RepID=UPI00054D8CF9|nr:hypothetical protein [Actinospica robiniae]
MALSLTTLDIACVHLHRMGERSHRVFGLAIPHLALVAADLTAHLIEMPDGIPDAAGSAQLRKHAAGVGAVAAAYGVEAWLGFVSVPSTGFERLAPDDLPRASEMPDRIEGVVTSAVWPGGDVVRHRITVITRTPYGSVLGQARWFAARDYGTNWWLEGLLAP